MWVGAHPDDAELGCGGTLTRWADEGAEVRALIFGEGPTSRGDQALDALVAMRAGQQVGIQQVDQHWFPDQQFDTVPILQFAKLIEQAIERFAPDTVVTHDSSDLNHDHRHVLTAVLAATRPLPDCPVRRLYAVEVAASSEYHFSERFRPTTFVPLQGWHLDRKLEALRVYGEVRPFPHPRSPEAIRAAAVYWGSVSGVPLAEALRLIREVV